MHLYITVQLHKTTYWSRHDTSPPQHELQSKGKPSEFFDVAVAKSEKDVTMATTSENSVAANGSREGEQKHRFVDPGVTEGVSADGRCCVSAPVVKGVRVPGLRVGLCYHFCGDW